MCAQTRSMCLFLLFVPMAAAGQANGADLDVDMAYPTAESYQYEARETCYTNSNGVAIRMIQVVQLDEYGNELLLGEVQLVEDSGTGELLPYNYLYGEQAAAMTPGSEDEGGQPGDDVLGGSSADDSDMGFEGQGDCCPSGTWEGAGTGVGFGYGVLFTWEATCLDAIALMAGHSICFTREAGSLGVGPVALVFEWNDFPNPHLGWHITFDAEMNDLTCLCFSFIQRVDTPEGGPAEAGEIPDDPPAGGSPGMVQYGNAGGLQLGQQGAFHR